MPAFTLKAPPELLHGDAKDMQKLRGYLLGLSETLCKALNDLDSENIRDGGLQAKNICDLNRKMVETARITMGRVKIKVEQLTLEGLVTANGNFKVLLDGSIEAKNANITGKITSEDGEIGGWKIGSGMLSAGAGVDHMALGAGDAAYRIWAGGDTPEEANFKVRRDGAVFLTKLYITGEDGAAIPDPVDLNSDYWKVGKAFSRSVQELRVVDGETLVITLQDGSNVNFKKAGYTAAQLKLSQSDPQGRTAVVYNAGSHSYSMQKVVRLYDADDVYLGVTATVNETSGTEAYTDGWNSCVDGCSGAYVIAGYTESTEKLYKASGEEAVGPWYKGTRAWRYTIPARK